MAEKKQYFIKLFDEKVAKALSDGGFSYTQENVTATGADGKRTDLTAYCFKGSKKFERALRKLLKETGRSDAVVATEQLLRF